MTLLRIKGIVYLFIVTLSLSSSFVFADMVVDPQGNVGIGTPSPGAKLDVDGTIRSKSGGYQFPDGTTLDSAARFGSPPLKISVGIKGNTSSWDCECNVDLEDYCGDEDGCTMRILMQHETDGNDAVRCQDGIVYIEQANLSSNRKAGKYGWSINSGGANRSFILGTTAKYEIFGPWDWMFIFNYTHGYCSQPASNGYSDPYEFTFMSNPSILTTVYVYD